jgi:hypothetical protein
LNLRQTQEVAAFIEQHRTDGPSILVGDFNFHRTGSAARYLAEAGYIDTFSAANPGRNNGSCCVCIDADYSNWFDACPEQRFHTADDHVYLIPGRVTAGEVLGSDFMLDAPFRENGRWLWGSDHKGIASQVRLSPRATTGVAFAVSAAESARVDAASGGL